MPPTPDEQAAFLDDLARARRVRAAGRRLLARPAYGERWGRHWLDLVRYAETNGYERDATKPYAWRYRDYVIRAFNADKPFDRFVMEQLAGDELPDAESRRDARSPPAITGSAPGTTSRPTRSKTASTSSTTSSPRRREVFLGLTLGCARCHNHKFEPLTMHDYYRMVAIFDPLQRPVNGRTERSLPLRTPAPIAAVASQGKSSGVPQGYFLHEPSTNPPVSHLLFRGQAASPGPVVGPGVPAVLVAAQPSFPQPDPAQRPRGAGSPWRDGWPAPRTR